MAGALIATTLDVVGRVEKVLAAAHDVRARAARQRRRPRRPTRSPTSAPSSTGCCPSGSSPPPARAPGDLTRYLTAIDRRLERLPHAVAADRERMLRVHAVQDAYDELVAALSPARAAAADVRDIARQIEELRVSLWAQQLGTPRPVSEQRIYRAIDAVRP